MSDNDLILIWNELINRKYEGESVDIDTIRKFNQQVQSSYDSGDISKKQFLKYAELLCYLSDTD